MQPAIFVQIPAYRDPEILSTIEDAVNKAEFPDRLHFGVCWQYSDGVDNKFLPRQRLPKNTRLISLPSDQTEGACWARHKVQSLYQGEDYTLSIDSHTRFIQNWDTELIDEFARCENPKAVISCYPAEYRQLEGNFDSTPIGFLSAAYYIDRLPRFNGLPTPTELDRPMRGLFIAAGFYFGKGSMIDDVPVDPVLYFNQEEFTLAARLWTHGYDLYSPTKNFVFHLYGLQKYYNTKNSLRLHWQDNPEWGQLNHIANLRAYHILGIALSHDKNVLTNIEHYSLGNVRQLDEFLSLSGIQFDNDTISPRAQHGEFIYDLNPWLERPE